MPAFFSLHRTRIAAGALLCAGMTWCAPAMAINLNQNDTSVQMFRWRWNDIASECRNWLGPQGYGAVQISPPSAAAKLGPWYDVYQPVNFTSLNSSMGSEAELQAMINTCHTAQVRVYADIVVNHLAPGSGVATDGTRWDAGSLSYPYFSGNDFHPDCDIADADYGKPGNRHNVAFCRLSKLPDLQTDGAYVQGQVRNYLNKLVGMGIDGFRFDAAKHMQASDLRAILDGVGKTSKAGETLWVTQEIIPDGNVVRADYFANGSLNEFVFASALKESFRNENGHSISELRAMMGTPGNWGGTWGFLPSEKATVFVNNWDTERNGASLQASNYSNGATSDMNGTKRYDLANIFMLAWPYGSAQIHSGYRFTGFDQGPPSSSPFDGNGNARINVEWDFIHRWSDIANMVAFRSATAGEGIDYYTSGNANQIAFGRGAKGYVAINNDRGAWNVTLQTRLPPGVYCNVVHGLANPARTACSGDSVTVAANGSIALAIPANDGGQVPAVALHIQQKLNACTVGVTLRVASAGTVFGQELYAAGNLAEFGNWSATAAGKLSPEGSGANVAWSRTFSVPASTPFQYKFQKYGNGGAIWESNFASASGNREGVSPACGAPALVIDGGNFRY